MHTNTTVLIVVTALAVLALAGVLVWVTYKTRGPKMSETIRDQVEDDALRLQRQQVLADEYAARAQAAEAEIEIKIIRACGRDNNRMSIAARRPPPAIH
jgi:hypothetical protein